MKNHFELIEGGNQTINFAVQKNCLSPDFETSTFSITASKHNAKDLIFQVSGSGDATGNLVFDFLPGSTTGFAGSYNYDIWENTSGGDKLPVIDGTVTIKAKINPTP